MSRALEINYYVASLVDNIVSKPVMKRVSPSAQACAYLRALEEDLSRDILAKYFVDDEGCRLGEAWLECYPGVARDVSLRSRYIEDVAAKFIEDKKIGQMVNIAAGINTFPYRHPSAKKLGRYAELDLPGMLEYKRSCIADMLEKGIIEETQVRVDYTPTNLIGEGFKGDLARMNINWNKPTIFVMEGISYYLTPELILQTLGIVSKFAAKGSVIVMDYFPAILKEGALLHRMMGLVTDRGDDYITGLNAGELKKLFKGYKIECDTAIPDIELEYCGDQKTLPITAIVVAKKT